MCSGIDGWDSVILLWTCYNLTCAQSFGRHLLLDCFRVYIEICETNGWNICALQTLHCVHFWGCSKKMWTQKEKQMHDTMTCSIAKFQLISESGQTKVSLNFTQHIHYMTSGIFHGTFIINQHLVNYSSCKG